MVQANNSKKQLSSATTKLPIGNNTTFALPLSDGSVDTMHLPLRYAGGDLGLTNGPQPWIEIVDASGRRYLTHSVQWVLRNIDLFDGRRDQAQLLACAAMHYGLGAHALMGADLDNMCDVWDVRNGTGSVLLAGVTYSVASDAAEEYVKRDGWEADIHIKMRIPGTGAGDWRHEGPLVLLHHNLGVTSFTGIAVKSHVGRCGMMLEEVLWRFNQFSHADQAELLAGLGKHFDLAPAQREMAGAA